MVDVTSVIPLSVGGLVALLVNTLIAWIVLMAANKIIAHNLGPKHTFIMAIIALFLAPVAVAFAASSLAIPFLSYIISLIVWIILGELLLRGEGAVTKLKVIIVAFVIYLILQIFLAPYIISLIPV